MTYALILVEKPKHGWPEGIDFYAHRLPKEEGIRQIVEGSWLVNLDTDLIVLAQIVVAAQKAKIPYHATFFDQKPSFGSAHKENHE